MNLADPKKIDKIFKNVNFMRSNDNKVDFHEFLMASIDKKKLLRKDKIKSAFEIIDVDQSDEITLQEFRLTFSKEKQLNNEIWDLIFKDLKEENIELSNEKNKNSEKTLKYKQFEELLEELKK